MCITEDRIPQTEPDLRPISLEEGRLAREPRVVRRDAVFDLYSETLALAMHVGLHARHPDQNTSDLQATIRNINERAQKIHRMAAGVAGYRYVPAIGGDE